MSAKIGRYIFRYIKGRLVPIRIGAVIREGVQGISRKAAAQAKLLVKHSDLRLNKAGKFTAPVSQSGTEATHKFMKKTGAIRFSQYNKHTTLDYTHKLTDPQRKQLLRLAQDTDVFAGRNTLGKDFGSIEDFLRSSYSRQGEELKATKLGKKLEEAALKGLGETHNSREVGYVTQRGKLIDLSGKKFGGSGGVRELDHREVAQFVPLPKAKKASDLTLTQALRRAQAQRKEFNKKSVHAFDTARRDWKNIKGWDDNSDFAKKIKMDYLQRFRDLAKARRAKRKK